MRLKIFSLFLFLLFACSLQAQTEWDNFQKYCTYRHRFSTYFTVIGEQQGECMVIGNRNRYLSTRICYGQHGIQMGYYMGMLATEYALLQRYGQTMHADSTLEELKLVLHAYSEYMDKCEHYFDKPDIVDGFFIRENVPVRFLDSTTKAGQKHLELLNRGLNASHIYVSESDSFYMLAKGMPAYINGLYQVYNTKEMMSQDEAYGIMMGLALVAKCVPPLADNARHLFKLIALHIIGKNAYSSCDNQGYIIKKPDCEAISESGGGSTALFGYGIACAAVRVTALPLDSFINTFSSKDYGKSLSTYTNTGKLHLPIGTNNMYYVWKICGRGIPGQQEWNRSMCATLGALGDSWGKHTDKSIVKNTYWTKGKKQHDWRTFYLSLWRFLHDKTPDKQECAMIQQELNTAPPYGPYNYKTKEHPLNFAPGGWAYIYRYRATISEQYEGSSLTGNFNGLDYMLMYNLYRLLYSDDNMPSYQW